MSYLPVGALVKNPGLAVTDALAALNPVGQAVDSGLVGSSSVLSSLLQAVFTEGSSPGATGAGFLDLFAINRTPNQLAVIDDAGNTLYLPGLVGFASSALSGTASTTTNIPVDNTVPGVGEGAQFHSLSYTPKSTNNTLLVIGLAVCGHTNASPLTTTVALFKDSALSAEAVAPHSTTQNGVAGHLVFHVETATATSSQTWKLRGGEAGSGTFYVNAAPFSGTQLYQSRGMTWLLVLEFAN